MACFSSSVEDTSMQIGIDSFAASYDDAGLALSPAVRLNQLVEQIELADQVGLDSFGVGEHHRKEYLDSAPAMILAAAATRTKKIRLTSAVAVLSAIDPVRLFQSFATLDLLSNGRAEIVAGRGSFIDAYPLFGLSLENYDRYFEENLDLLLRVRENEHVTWKGRYGFRPALTGQGVYPRPIQNPLPVWVGVGGTPASFQRAGVLGLPLMVAIIGGETRRFRPLVDLYRGSAAEYGHAAESLKVGMHSVGYIAETSKQAADEFYPGFAKAIASAAEERGFGEMTRPRFDSQLGPYGAMLVGEPSEVAEKMLRHSEALGDLSRITFQMNASSVPHAKLMHAIELLGTRVAPIVRREVVTT
jgi:probable LLM family oxidoreductase